jgi:hypothetical protein
MLPDNGEVKVSVSLLGNGYAISLQGTHATIDELLDTSFSMQPLSYQVV